jgi:hypothetical protein
MNRGDTKSLRSDSSPNKSNTNPKTGDNLKNHSAHHIGRKSLSRYSPDKSQMTDIDEIEQEDIAFKEIPIGDKIMLGPIEKYTYYNKFPYKMVIHILLCFLTATQALLLMDWATGYDSNQTKLFQYYFLDDSLDYSDFDIKRSREFYNLSTL